MEKVYILLISFWYEVTVWSYQKMLNCQYKMAKRNDVNLPYLSKQDNRKLLKRFFYLQAQEHFTK